jgi:hypothetical protein
MIETSEIRWSALEHLSYLLSYLWRDIPDVLSMILQVEVLLWREKGTARSSCDPYHPSRWQGGPGGHGRAHHGEIFIEGTSSGNPLVISYKKLWKMVI